MHKLSFLCIIVAAFTTFGHETVLTVDDNGDGTILIKTSLSTGENAEGALVIIKDKSSGQPLSRFSLPASGGKVVDMPTVPYTVTLMMDKGHSVTKGGPFTARPATVQDSLAAVNADFASQDSASAEQASVAPTPSLMKKIAASRYTGPLAGLMCLSLVGFGFAVRTHRGDRKSTDGSAKDGDSTGNQA